MKEHPLLMQGPLVRATLAGLKTQTRRPIRPQPRVSDRGCPSWGTGRGSRRLPGVPVQSCGGKLVSVPDLLEGMGPLGQAGDRLWVRETWTAAMHDPKGPADCLYRADDNRGVEDLAEAKWTPSLHMPRWACRLVLPLVSVRVERVQDITEEDAKAEGVEPVLMRGIGSYPEWMRPTMVGGHQKAFELLWKQIYGDALWDLNPWVWVAEWKEIEVSK